MNNDPFSLAGRIYLVTGASSDTGAEVCKVINSLGGNFIAAGIDEEKLAALVAQCGTGSKYITADLSVEKDLDRIIDSFEQLDGIVHGECFVSFQHVTFYNMEVFNKMQAINVNSIVYLVDRIYKMKKLNNDSSIVLVSSMVAIAGLTGAAYYCATTAELIALSRVWAYELAPATRTRVNCVSPGIAVPDAVFSNADLSDADASAGKYQIGSSKAEDAANTIAFLLSDASKWLTGQNIAINGGKNSD